ncbi:hypothetical protein [Brachybacterium huguangmaarense]
MAVTSPVRPPGATPPLSAARLGPAAVCASAVAVLAVVAARGIIPDAVASAGESGLLLWIAAALALAIAGICGYLAVIWILAALVVVTDGSGAIGRLGAGALRALAPRLARRAVATALLASSITGAGLATAQARDTAPDAVAGATSSSGASALVDVGRPEAASSPLALPRATLAGRDVSTSPSSTGTFDASAPRSVSARATLGAERTGPGTENGSEAGDGASDGGGADGRADDPGSAPSTPPGGADAPPPLGWGEEPTPTQPAPDEPRDPVPPAPAPPADPVHPDEPDSSARPVPTYQPIPSEQPAPSAQPAPADEPTRVVVVERGDSLWRITDELLGPGRDSDAAIAAAWPALYAANRDVIGPDPDLIEPGQRLVVPHDLPRAHSAANQEQS